jgi:large subunit ribosomal protein L13e
MKHNNVLPNAHFRKHWQQRVKTWFDQAGRKQRRRSARVEKTKRMAPRPTELLRPAVHCPTVKYNTRLRAGRGFTFEEVKAAGLTVAYARSVGIAVDHRRRNKCEESLELNKQRLLAYISRLVVFPKKSTQASEATQVCLSKVMPIVNDASVEPARKITEQDKQSSAHGTIRKAWGMKRYAGLRAKIAAEKAEAAEIKEKK